MNPTPATLRPVSLTVDARRDEPRAVGSRRPTLAWRLDAGADAGATARQRAFEVVAASSVDDLDAARPRWSSGRIESADQSVVLGTDLASRETVAWRVRVWDDDDLASPWSAASTFRVGLLDAGDWSAQWIDDPAYTYATDGIPHPLPVFARGFDTPVGVATTVVSAVLSLTGLGQYVATLNGEPISPAVLEPGQTSYWAEVAYRSWDVAALLREGRNVLGIEVGSGVYQQADTNPIGRYNFQPEHKQVMGTPKVIAQLELTFADGSVERIVTDESWVARSGATTFSSWWGGEDYDGRILAPDWSGAHDILDDAAWHPARLAVLDHDTIPRLDTPLVADPRPPVTVAETAHPVSITAHEPTPVAVSVVASAPAGSDVLHVDTVERLFPGDTVTGDAWGGGASAVVAQVGTAASRVTELRSAVEAGSTTLAVADAGTAHYPGAVASGTDLFVIGQGVAIGDPRNAEIRRVVAVSLDAEGDADGGTVELDVPLDRSHDAGAAVRGLGSGIRVTGPLDAEVPAGTALVSAPLPAFVLDFGRNLVGLPEVSGSHPAGTTVTLLGSENPEPPTDLDTVGEAGIYRYTFGGADDERWRARFTYNGQRYLVVRGLREAPTPETVAIAVTHAANEPTATFDTGDRMLQAIFDISLRALEGNMMSVLTDCPNREKGPYTGDNLHNIDTELTLFDMRAYQRQLVANMRTSQRPHPIGDARQPGLYAGLIANIAPEFHPVPDGLYNERWFLDDPHWGGAIIRIPWELHRVTGDDTTLRPNYAAMKAWLEYVGRSKATNASGEIHGLGDWIAGHDTVPAEAIIDVGYYEGARVLAKIADHLGETADAERYTSLADELAAAYNARYLHVHDESGRAWYANDTQASNAIALDAGLVPDEHRAAVVASLIAAVAGFDDRLSHGSVGGGPVFRQLHAAGRDDLILRMVTNPQAPSYAFQVERGQTTLAEDLSGGQSQNHHFLGQVVSWLVHDLVGIAQHPNSTGYERMRFYPASGGEVEQLARLEATYLTPRGRSSARVLRADGILTLEIEVPPNTDAEVWVPVAGPVQAPAGAERMRDKPGHAVFRVGPGRHTFTSSRG